MTTARCLFPDEPITPRRYCAALHDFLLRRGRVILLISQLAHKPANREADARMLGAIYFIRGEAFVRRDA